MAVFGHFEIAVPDIRVTLRDAVRAVHVATHGICPACKCAVHEHACAASQHFAALAKTIALSNYT